MAEKKRVVLVGHCGPDIWMLRSAIGTMRPDAEVVAVNSSRELESALSGSALLLVNRVLDGSFGTRSGIELIGSLSGRDGAPALALVSDHGWAQEEARSVGARRGFGKSDMHSEEMRASLVEALGEG